MERDRELKTSSRSQSPQISIHLNIPGISQNRSDPWRPPHLVRTQDTHTEPVSMPQWATDTPSDWDLKLSVAFLSSLWYGGVRCPSEGQVGPGIASLAHGVGLRWLHVNPNEYYDPRIPSRIHQNEMINVIHSPYQDLEDISNNSTLQHKTFIFWYLQ